MHIEAPTISNTLEALASDAWAGDGEFSRRCEAAMRATLGAGHVILTPSCTAALEMCALLAGVGPGDEVIMPSFGFSSAANAVVLRGGVPVFVDIRPDTLNIDEKLVFGAMTDRTRAVMVVHYAGVCCEMAPIWALTSDNPNVCIIEDAAQAYLSAYDGRLAGTLGDMAAFSFHQTKNIRCGEGGAFVTGDDIIGAAAQIVREKGTNRSAFLSGLVDKYTWVSVGMSALPSELQAAVLLPQLLIGEAITTRRAALWNRYHAGLAHLGNLIERPTIPAECHHNAHIYRIMLPTAGERDRVLAALRSRNIGASFHFVPLHSSPAGLTYGRVGSAMTVTDDASARLLRLPLSHRTTADDVDRVVEAVARVVG